MPADAGQRRWRPAASRRTSTRLAARSAARRRRARPARLRAPPRRRRPRRRVPRPALAVVARSRSSSWPLVPRLALPAVQAATGDGHGRRARSRRARAPARSATCSPSAASSRRRFFFALRARSSGKRARCTPGTYMLQQDMSYGAALDALTQEPAAATTVARDDPRGHARAARSRRSSSQRGLRGSYLAAARALAAARPAPLRRAAARTSARGLPVPGDLRAQARARPATRRSSTSSSSPSSSNFAQRRPAHARAART